MKLINFITPCLKINHLFQDRLLRVKGDVKGYVKGLRTTLHVASLRTIRHTANMLRR